jgi:hypothetical protein
MTAPRLTPPPPDYARRWPRTAARLLLAGLPSVLVIVAAVYAGSTMLYQFAATAGPLAEIALDLAVLTVAGPLFHWLAFGLAARLAAGARGLVLPTRLAPASTLAAGSYTQLLFPLAWVTVMAPLAFAIAPEGLFSSPGGRASAVIGIGVMAAGSYTTAQLLRMARGQYLGADEGPEPALHIEDRILLHKILIGQAPRLAIPAGAVYLPAVLLMPSLAILVCIPQAWAVLTCYIAALNLWGGTGIAAPSRAETPRSQTAGATS